MAIYIEDIRFFASGRFDEGMPKSQLSALRLLQHDNDFGSLLRNRVFGLGHSKQPQNALM